MAPTATGATFVARPAAGVVLFILLVACGTILATELLRGWYAYDEGLFGQAAERVLLGDVPHRDFDEPYTGLLTYFHAAVFSVLGIGSVPMRLALAASALGWAAMLYRILLRFAPPPGAALVALTAFVWSVPNYPAAVPSWYVLFAATAGAFAMLRWHESMSPRWLMAAGAAGAVAFLVKSPGILFFLGGGLALLVGGRRTGVAVHDERTGVAVGGTDDRESLDPTTGDDVGRGRTDWLPVAAFAAAALLLAFVAGQRWAPELLRYVLPGTVMTAAVVAGCWSGGPAASRLSGRDVLARIRPFAIGAVVPIAVFVAWMAMEGALPAMLQGVFITPLRRLSIAALRPPPVTSLLFALPVILLLWLPSTRGARVRWVPAMTVLLGLIVVVFSASDDRLYRLGWFSVWGLLFFVVSAGAWLAGWPSAGEVGKKRAAAAMLACIAIGMSLIEYPYAAAIYTVYALPLTLLAAAAAVRTDGRVGTSTQLALTGFILAFGLLRAVPGRLDTLGIRYVEEGPLVPLELERAGLSIRPYEAVAYERLIPFVQELSRGRRVWAGPDAPEIYFLGDVRNHSRTIFDFLDRAGTRAIPLVDRLDSLNIAVVVLKLQPPFSARPSDATITQLREAFPDERHLPGFLVLWR